jgi:hypothetical protein
MMYDENIQVHEWNLTNLRSWVQLSFTKEGGLLSYKNFLLINYLVNLLFNMEATPMISY